MPETAWSEAADAELRLCEMRIKNAAAGIHLNSMANQPNTELPELSQEYLKNEYPELLQSLLSVLQSTGKRLSEHL